MNRRDLVVICSFFLLTSSIIGVYAGTVGVNNLFGFTNGYGFTWLNSTNVEATEYYLDGINKTDLFTYPIETTSFTVWQNSGVYFAKNGDTGVVTSNTTPDLGALLNSLIATSDQVDIFVREGNYTVATQISWLDKYVYLHGIGVGSQYQDKGTRFIKGVNGDMIKINYTVPNLSGFAIEKIEIDGLRSTYTGRGISIYNAKGFTMRDVIIKDCKSNALYVVDSGWHRLYNVFTADCEADIIYYDSCNDWQWYGVEADTVQSMDEDAVYLDDSKGEIIGGHFESGLTFGRAAIYADDWILVDGARIGLCGTTGIWLNQANFSKIIGCRFYDINARNDAEGHGIRLVKTGNSVIVGNTFENRTYGHMKRCIRMLSGSENNIIEANVFNGSSLSAISDPANNRVHNNIGYITENSGTGSITSGGTTDVITHGLDYTPIAGDIRVTLTENPTNSPGAIWVDTIGAAQFTVNCENDPGASNLDFSWGVQRIK